MNFKSYSYINLSKSFIHLKKTVYIFRQQTETEFILNCLEESDDCIKSILRSAGDELFVATRVAGIIGTRVDLTRTEAMRRAVTKRIGILEYAYITTLNTYVKVSKLAKHPEVTQIISELRDTSFKVIQSQLPYVLQFLEDITQIKNRQDRLDKLESLVETNGSKKNYMMKNKNTSINQDTFLERLYYAVNQILEDIECQEIIADISLLAMIVMVREDIRTIGHKHNLSKIHHKMGYPNNQLPKFELAFLKELMTLCDSERRRALIKDAFLKDDRIMYETRNTESPEPSSANDRLKTETKKKIRPGRFVDSLIFMKTEMMKTGDSQAQEKRIQEILSDCLASLEDIACSSPKLN
eukprot:gnl/TRDRNA2_/TRDRNA2_175549_c0_seq1.p1 gnl/TRDRNA2_/TRDRNA2_175549_c0~~gnl/TRDRNA2_/TRDRNA2_175549_c0_seq1.p1  ORF type:complete len:354 (-),score=-11.23 gnl/TRDRNA2_/TRDRNA2_175549_c0_seq1:138-1199(-)